MIKYQEFIFKDFKFDPGSKVLDLTYSFDNKINFQETYKFNFDFVSYDAEALDRALQSLFVMAGVSYYKAYLAPKLRFENVELSEEMAQFFSKTYERGLGEFFYVNGLDPNTKINFPVGVAPKPVDASGEGLLVGIGGGKDSLVSVELLRGSNFNVTTWSLGHREQLTNLVETIGLPHLWVERTWDRSLLELNKVDAYNGHIPISAIIACVGSVVAILSGKRDAVVSNESSASEPDLEYRGVQINHQYSKSLEFEKDYQHFLGGFDKSPRYYSYLRPLSEVRIAEIFAEVGFSKYRGVFSSCNRAFTHDSDHIFWCGECPKCAFTFLALTPFIDRSELEDIWGKNLLIDPNLESVYRQLLGLSGNKPLDCVGEVKESRAAMRLAQKLYPELNKYVFEIPHDYNYKQMGESSMPPDVLKQLNTALEELN